MSEQLDQTFTTVKVSLTSTILNTNNTTGTTMNSGTFSFSDSSDCTKIRKARVTVETQGICIQPEGTGVFDGADCGPIYLEFQNGKPVLYVWKDINGEDPVRIDLDGALESARREPLEVQDFHLTSQRHMV